MKLNILQKTEQLNKLRDTRRHLQRVRNELENLRREFSNLTNDEVAKAYVSASSSVSKHMGTYSSYYENAYYWVEENSKSLDEYGPLPVGMPSLPLFASEAEVKEFFNFYSLKRPLSKVMKLKREKTLYITKLSKVNGVWTRGDEESLKHFKEKQKESKEREYSDSAMMIRNLRDKRSRMKQIVTVTITRGEFSVSRSDYGMSFKNTKEAYIELRRAISHARAKEKQSIAIDGHFGYRVGGVYTQNGLVFDKTKDKAREVLRKDKAPTKATAHVGVELEFCSKSKGKVIIDALMFAGLSANVALKADGSLRVSEFGDYTHELTILAMEREYPEIINRVCTVLRSTGGYVNKTCGMHVHLDMRKRNPEGSYTRLLKSLEILYRMTPPERRYNKYCQRNAPDMAWSPNQENRYWAINAAAYARHKTIEVRLHSGSLNATKINNWVQLLLHIINTPNTIAYRGVERFIEGMKIPKNLGDYIMQRVAKFDTEGTDYDDEHTRDIYNPSTDNRPQCGCADCQVSRVTGTGRYTVEGNNVVEHAYA